MLIVLNLNFVKNLAEILVSNNQVLQAIVNIIAIISGIGGIIIGVASFRISSLEAVKEYFSQGDTAEMKERRKYIYDKVKNGEKIGPNDLNASVVCSYFHFWGLMVKKRYLPIWIFESASGTQVLRLYRYLEEHIEEKRKENPFYAEYFEWLAKKIEKKYGKKWGKF